MEEVEEQSQVRQGKSKPGEAGERPREKRRRKESAASQDAGGMAEFYKANTAGELFTRLEYEREKKRNRGPAARLPDVKIFGYYVPGNALVGAIMFVLGLIVLSIFGLCKLQDIEVNPKAMNAAVACTLSGALLAVIAIARAQAD